jgi:nucleotide-binding universal stress UspA family protein
MAVAPAATFSRLLHAPLAFVHVAAGERGDTVLDGETRQADFRSYALPLAGEAFGEATAQVLEGSPPEQILEFTGGQSLLVLASHGRGGLRAVLIGSVADKVVRGSKTPVVVVPALEPSPDIAAGPFLVALDGSAQAGAGLAAARQIATAAGAKVVLVRAFSLVPPPALEFGYYVTEILEGVEQEARDYLKSVAAPGDEQLVGQGPADIVIVEAAKSAGASLVVMTTEGMGRARRIALGSTTDRVLHSLKRPLFIIPPGAAEAGA